MARAHQIVLIVAVILASWLGMQAVHELGHVLGAWLTGGEVTKVVLDPLTISRTDLGRNPHPLIVVWAGPIFGVVFPLILWVVMASLRLPGTFVARFAAGFCLVANGAYLAGGSFGRVGDCGVMLQHGSQPWQLWLFGAATIPAGFWLWHGQGPNFGLGPAKVQVSAGVAWATLTVALLLTLLGFSIGGR